MTFDIRIWDENRTDLAKMFGELDFRRGVEVGVGKGVYSKTLCKHVKGLEKLYLVDTWKAVYDDPFNENCPIEKHERYYRIAKEMVEGYPCEFIRKTSIEAIQGIDYESLDFAYIDGSHTFDYAMVDIIEWARRVREGGIMAGDDYKTSKNNGVIAAVNTYVQMHGIKTLNLINKRDLTPRGYIPNWWFVK